MKDFIKIEYNFLMKYEIFYNENAFIKIEYDFLMKYEIFEIS